MIDWIAFLLVFAVALVGSAFIVSAYSLGLRLLGTSGRIPVVSPAEFTDAITIVTPAEAKSAAKKARKASKKNPLSDAQKRLALVGAYSCFTVSGLAVLYGIYLIVPYFHQ